MKKNIFSICLGILFLGFMSGCGGGGGGIVTAGGGALAETSAPLVSIEVSPVSPVIALGTTTQLSATGIYSDNTKKDLTPSVTWNTSNAAVATIHKGLAGAVGHGSVTIEATAESISGSTTLTVTMAALVSIQVSPVDSDVALGTTRQFTATGTFSDHSVQDLTSQVTWNSSTEAVVSMSNAAGSHGLATPAGLGSTTIFATLAGVTGTTSITVTSAALVSILVTPTDPGIPKGTTQQFFAMGIYSDHSIQDLTTQVVWSSSDPCVADTSNAEGSHGRTTSLAVGSTVIKAALGSASGTTTLSVSPATLISMQVEPANPGIPKGTTLQFIATGIYSDHSTQDLTTQVVWVSSDPCIARISNAAATSGLAAAVDKGSTTIKASSGSISAAVLLTVTSSKVDNAIEALRRQIRDLSPGAFKNVNSQNTLLNKLNAIVANMEAGDDAAAIDQLRHDMLAKTDGCANSGVPDSNDWIVDCASQSLVYPLILDVIGALSSL